MSPVAAGSASTRRPRRPSRPPRETTRSGAVPRPSPIRRGCVLLPSWASSSRHQGGGATSYRVVQWTTGHIGRAAVRGILRHPDLELVGAYAWSEEKDGVDVGELCGIEPLGVAASADSDTIL